MPKINTFSTEHKTVAIRRGPSEDPVIFYASPGATVLAKQEFDLIVDGVLPPNVPDPEDLPPQAAAKVAARFALINAKINANKWNKGKPDWVKSVVLMHAEPVEAIKALR